ncbi:MAG TPA: hypothetical protein VGH28_16420 [Polyangiaceae bacterium]|jgi:hypothetical protein
MGKVAVLASLVSLALACSSAPDVACAAGADCASGICRSDGTCAPVTANDASPPFDASEPDVSPVTDGAKSDAPVTGCVPNDDGTITASEAPLGPGLHAKYRIATNVTVSTAGQTQNDGSRIWDLSGALSGDGDVDIDTVSTQGAWYGAQFATASYATQLSPTADLLGVFRFGGGELALEGIASPSQQGAYTEVSYNPEAIAVQFPLTMNATWASTSTVSGTAGGVPVLYYENYQSKVDAHGTIKTPYGTFQVLRIATVLTKTVGPTITITRTFSFFAECATQVATVVSQADEPNAEFTNASLVERLTP